MVKRSSLYVEGTDDQHVVKHLLLRHGVECPFDDEVVPAALPPVNPKIKRLGNKDKVLHQMETAVKFATGRSVGFVCRRRRGGSEQLAGGASSALLSYLQATNRLADRWLHRRRTRLRRTRRRLADARQPNVGRP